MSIIEMRLPEYTTELPISKVIVKFRPFTVKEEKILLLAQEENQTELILNAINQILTNCTFGKYNIDNINKIDFEYLFVQIRNKSMGEGINVKGICKSCKAKTPLLLDLSAVVVKNKDKKIESVQLADNVWVTFKYPTIKEAMKMAEEDGLALIAYSIDSFIEGDSIKSAADYSLDEKIEFLESLTVSQLEKFNVFFDSFPTLMLDVNYTCSKCNEENKIHIEGIEHFFG